VIDREPTTPIRSTPKRSRMARKTVMSTTTIKRKRSRPDSNFIGRATERFFKEERGQIS
jgi:hypothetical protein